MVGDHNDWDVWADFRQSGRRYPNLGGCLLILGFLALFWGAILLVALHLLRS